MTDTSNMTPEYVLRQFLEATQEGFWHIDVQGLTIDVNPAMCEILARERQDILGRSIYDFVDETNYRIFQHQLDLRKRGVVGPYEIELQRADGSNVPCINNATPVYDDNGAKVSSIGLWTEITEFKNTHADLVETSRAALKTAAEAKLAQATLEQRVKERTLDLERANEALRVSQEQYRSLIELSPDAVFVHVDRKIVFANPTMVELMEADSVDQLIGLEALDVMHPDFHERVQIMRVSVARTGKLADFEEMQYRSLKGNTIEVDSSASLTTWGGEKAYLVVARDITYRKRMERQLIQSQKLEAVGQLTGGVAHDFNNLLAVIVSSTEFLADEVGDDHNMVLAVGRAAARGSELTQRLLMFSRQQVLEPKSVDLAALVAGLHDLLDRTLGEIIEVEVAVDDGLWRAMADPGQLENGLLNLAINARDAMPDGGKLSIECMNEVLDEARAAQEADVPAGQYAVLAVTDSGSGMSEEVRARAFEPFFTTKDVGKGSGLGLSMIYGFAKESGGFVTIDSAQTAGTTVKLYLPRGGDEPSARTAAADLSAPHGSGSPHGSGERVLATRDTLSA